MAGKPLALAAYAWAGKRLGADGLRGLLETAYRLQFSMTGARRPLLSAYRRVVGREVPPAEAEAFLGRLAARYADSMTSLYTLDQLPMEERVSGVETPAVEAAQALRKRGKGVILASPHYGNLPLALAALAARGVPMTVMFLHGGAYKWCEAAFGFKVTSLGESAADYWRALKANEAVMAYSDLDFFPENRTADFFGAPVRPPHGVARLAAASGAPVLPVYEVFEGGRHRVVADAPIEPEGGAEAVEGALLRSMERFIAARPDHWLVLRDVWDIAAGDRLNKRMLASAALFRRFFASRG